MTMSISKAITTSIIKLQQQQQQILANEVFNPLAEDTNFVVSVDQQSQISFKFC